MATSLFDGRFVAINEEAASKSAALAKAKAAAAAASSSQKGRKRKRGQEGGGSEEKDKSKGSDDKSKKESEVLSREIFVANIALDVTKKQLHKVFKKYGDIESSRFRSLPITGTKVKESSYKLVRRASAIKGLVNSAVKDSMNAYVKFVDASSVEKALEANNTVLNGKHLRVDRATPVQTKGKGFRSSGKGGRDQHDFRRSVFLGNVDKHGNEEELREFFSRGVSGGSDCVLNVRMIRDRSTQEVSGVGIDLGLVSGARFRVGSMVGRDGVGGSRLRKPCTHLCAMICNATACNVTQLN